MHKTDAGEKRKALRRDARELEREIKVLAKVKQMEPARKVRQDEVDRLRTEAASLKDKARLEDLHVWEMKKTKSTRKGSMTYGYWMASWHEDGRTRNVHLGNSRKLSREEALQKAREMKAEAIGC